MHIQFVGVPGSGKSTIVDDLLKKYPEKYIRGNKFYSSFIKMFLKNPLVAFRCVIICLSILPMCIRALRKSDVLSSYRYKAIYGLFVNIGNFILTKNDFKNDNKIIVWDELVYQRALSIFSYSTLNAIDNELDQYIKWADRSFSVFPIFLSCNLELNKKRLYERGLPKRMKNFNKNTIENIIINQHSTVFKIKKFSKNSFFLDSSKDSLLNVELLHSKIISLYADL